MAQQQTYLTQEGLQKLQEELEHLRTVRRREVAEQLKKAAEVGGTVDNAEYDEAKREQGRIEGRILELETLLQGAILIPSHVPRSSTVQVGSRVLVADEKGQKIEYTIVGRTESDPGKGKISNESPVGKAILGKKVGQVAEAQTPAGVIKLKLLKIL